MNAAHTLSLIRELRTLEHIHTQHQNPGGTPTVSQAAAEAAHTCRLELGSMDIAYRPMSHRLGSRPRGV